VNSIYGAALGHEPLGSGSQLSLSMVSTPISEVGGSSGFRKVEGPSDDPNANSGSETPK